MPPPQVAVQAPQAVKLPLIGRHAYNSQQAKLAMTMSRKDTIKKDLGVARAGVGPGAVGAAIERGRVGARATLDAAGASGSARACKHKTESEAGSSISE